MLELHGLLYLVVDRDPVYGWGGRLVCELPNGTLVPLPTAGAAPVSEAT